MIELLTHLRAHFRTTICASDVSAVRDIGTHRQIVLKNGITWETPSTYGAILAAIRSVRDKPDMLAEVEAEEKA